MSNINILVWRCAELVIVLFLCSCSGNGYITSSVSTVLGLDVSENPKTQVPHVRFGYVRNGLYYVPTGKTEIANGGSTTSSGQANETPTVVSEIFVHSKFLTDITISEKFAIGGDAVQSRAAEQSFRNQGAQSVAGGGTPTVVEPPPPRTIVQQVLPPRSEERTVSAAEFKKHAEEREARVKQNTLQADALQAVSELRIAVGDDNKVDWGKLLDAAGGPRTPNKPTIRRSDFYHFVNNNEVDQKHLDAIIKEAKRQKEQISPTPPLPQQSLPLPQQSPPLPQQSPPLPQQSPPLPQQSPPLPQQ